MPVHTERPLLAPHPPAVKREAKVSRPCSSATYVRKAPQVVTEAFGTPTQSARALENVRPSLPVGSAGRAFRRRHRTNNEVANSAVCIDIGEVAENTDGRDSSLARCYDALGAQVFSICDRPESAPRPPSSPAGNLKRRGRPLRSTSCGSNSATTVLDCSTVSAMALDLGHSVQPMVEIVPCRPAIPQTKDQKLRAISVGGARFGKKGALELLPAIKPKSTGRRLSHSVTTCRTNDPLAWNLGISRRNLDSIGAVF